MLLLFQMSENGLSCVITATRRLLDVRTGRWLGGCLMLLTIQSTRQGYSCEEIAEERTSHKRETDTQADGDRQSSCGHSIKQRTPLRKITCVFVCSCYCSCFCSKQEEPARFIQTGRWCWSMLTLLRPCGNYGRQEVSVADWSPTTTVRRRHEPWIALTQ